MNIINDVEAIYDRGEMSYPLSTYVDRDIWKRRFQENFPDKYIDNLTDFNYNKCFTVCIHLSDANAGIGSKEFDEYIIKNGVVYEALIEISALFPYCILKYSKYYFLEGEIENECRDIPYCKEHTKFDQEIRDILDRSKLILLDDEVLMTEIPGKSLELREAPVSAYNCLFQDTYAYYPYTSKGRYY
ncbi:hypothetical protein [Clostridium sp. YIM B02551]|uniref:hypothetical protein n=1 Tax=Clostridium sp. YIM B02551 TaxID=2910679 RepID=UPI001EECAA7A|nr:hypothetical protein [Clostridium sp. YIM B02551]